MKGNNPTYGESTPCMALVCLKPFPYLGKEIKGHQHVVLFRCCFRLFLFIALFVIQSLQYTDKELMAAALASDDMKSIEVTCSPFRVPMTFTIVSIIPQFTNLCKSEEKREPNERKDEIWMEGNMQKCSPYIHERDIDDAA